MYCMNCGGELQENAKFCSHCGKPVVVAPLEQGSGTILCPRCGREVEKDAELCPNCKYPFTQAAILAQQEKKSKVEQTPPRVSPNSPWAKFSYGIPVESQKTTQSNKCICGAEYPFGTFYCPKCKRDLTKQQSSVGLTYDYRNPFAFLGFIGSILSELIVTIPVFAIRCFGLILMVASLVFGIIGVRQTSRGFGYGRGFGIAAICINSIFLGMLLIIILLLLPTVM